MTAKIIHIGEPVALCCDQCGGDLLRVWWAEYPKRVTVECVKCGHSMTMEADV